MAECGAMPKREGFAEEKIDDLVEEFSVQTFIVAGDVVYFVYGVIFARKSLVRKSIGINVQGDAQAMQCIGLVGIGYADTQYVPGNMTVGEAHQLANKPTTGVLSCWFATVSGQKMKRHPHLMIRQFI